jgi:hypothetical protein
LPETKTCVVVIVREFVESIFLPSPVKQFIRENKLYYFSSGADSEKTNIWKLETG